MTTPYVDPALVKHLRERREWQDRAPEPLWDQRKIDRSIGANEVLRYLEEQVARQNGVI